MTHDDHPFARELAFTATYQRHRQDHPARREAACLRVQLPGFFAPIREGDLLTGRIDPPLVGVTPDEWGSTAFGFYHLPDEIEARLAASDLDPEEQERVRAMRAFWDEESTSAKLRRAYPERMQRYLPSDDWMHEPGVAFPLYRLTGGNVDYHKLVRLGLPGLREEVEAHRAQTGDADAHALYDGFLGALDALEGVIRRYAREAREHAAASSNLVAMADALERLPERAPATLREAAQLVWLYGLAADVRNHGRMDVYLGPFLARDLAAGRLTEHEALRLLQSLWQLMADLDTVVHNRVVVGGVGRPHEADADRFALLALEASRTVLEAEPQLTLRFYDGQHPALLSKAIDVLGEGRTYPLLYNDDVNVPAVEAAFGFSREEAEQYVPFGCGEYILEHRSFGTPSGVVNLLKALEVTLRDGVDPVTGRVAGLRLGSLHDFGTFEELWQAYARQVEHFVDLLAEHEALEYEVAGREAPFLLLSLLYDDCLARGKGAFDGGIRYLGGTVETYGTTNAADSLLALRRMLYEEEAVTPDELLAALDADFDGHALLRRRLLELPKYGNDDEEADAMLLRVHDHVCRYVRSQRERVPLHSYLVVNINNSANTLMGRGTAASPDGRRAGTPMNNGNAPSSGNDRSGVTALLNSVVKPDPSIHAGLVQNMKFSPELFRRRRPALEALLGTYFDEGGTQAMITVVSRGDLERALEEPEAYRHLFVRVGGFSARFVDLPRDVQEDILGRTLYE